MKAITYKSRNLNFKLQLDREKNALGNILLFTVRFRRDRGRQIAMSKQNQQQQTKSTCRLCKKELYSNDSGNLTQNGVIGTRGGSRKVLLSDI